MSKPTSFTSSKTFVKPAAKKPPPPAPKPKPTPSTSKQDPPKPATSSSMFLKKEQRYLPGDIRYKGPQNGASKNGEKRSSTGRDESPEPKKPKVDPYKAALNKYSGSGSSSSKPSSSKTTTLSERAMEERRRAVLALGKSESSSKKDSRSLDRDRYDDRDRGRDQRRDNGYDRRDSGYDRRDSRGYDQRDSRGYGRRNDYDAYDGYEDEYDSEMDDFIDDTDLDDLQRADFEESLKMINPRYNKQLWKHRESMIDERRMHANFKDIEMEERRSARMGIMEDAREAEKGSRGL